MNKYILLLVLVLVVGGAFLWSMEVRGEGSLVSTVCVDSDGGNNVNIKGVGMQYPRSEEHRLNSSHT